MKKETKALSGASQDAYFRRVLKAHPNLSAAERDRIVRQLREEVAQLRLRVKVDGDIAASPAPPSTPAAAAYGLTQDEVELRWRTAPPRMPFGATGLQPQETLEAAEATVE